MKIRIVSLLAFTFFLLENCNPKFNLRKFKDIHAIGQLYTLQNNVSILKLPLVNSDILFHLPQDVFVKIIKKKAHPEDSKESLPYYIVKYKNKIGFIAHSDETIDKKIISFRKLYKRIPSKQKIAVVQKNNLVLRKSPSLKAATIIQLKKGMLLNVELIGTRLLSIKFKSFNPWLKLRMNNGTVGFFLRNNENIQIKKSDELETVSVKYDKLVKEELQILSLKYEKEFEEEYILNEWGIIQDSPEYLEADRFEPLQISKLSEELKMNIAKPGAIVSLKQKVKYKGNYYYYLEFSLIKGAGCFQGGNVEELFVWLHEKYLKVFHNYFDITYYSRHKKYPEEKQLKKEMNFSMLKAFAKMKNYKSYKEVDYKNFQYTKQNIKGFPKIDFYILSDFNKQETPFCKWAHSYVLMFKNKKKYELVLEHNKYPLYKDINGDGRDEIIIQDWISCGNNEMLIYKYVNDSFKKILSFDYFRDDDYFPEFKTPFLIFKSPQIKYNPSGDVFLKKYKNRKVHYLKLLDDKFIEVGKMN